MSFYRDASVDVLVVLVLVYPVAKSVHGEAGGVAQMVSVLEPADDDAGEDVACARELDGDFVVGEEEVFLGEMIVAHYGSVI